MSGSLTLCACVGCCLAHALLSFQADIPCSYVLLSGLSYIMREVSKVSKMSKSSQLCVLIFSGAVLSAEGRVGL